MKTKSQTHHQAKPHGVNQPLWQAKLVALRQGNKLPTFGSSDNAFDTVAENRWTYGRATHAKWDYNEAEATGKLVAHAIERKDKRESGKWASEFIPCVRPCHTVRTHPDGKVAVWQGDRETQRYFVAVTDAVTKEEKRIPVTVTRNIVTLLSYGTIIEFSMSNRSKGTFRNGRDGKSHPLSFAKAELRRMLGLTHGDEAFAHLATLPPSRKDAAQPGSTTASASLPA